jgi:hypothetical protein
MLGQPVTGPSLGTCQAKRPSGLPLLWQVCGDPATAIHRYRCEYGHERAGATCDAHHPEPGVVGCAACWDAGREVPMIVVEATRG